MWNVNLETQFDWLVEYAFEVLGTVNETRDLGLSEVEGVVDVLFDGWYEGSGFELHLGWLFFVEN